MERFGDHTAGVALNTEIIVLEDINACDYYEEFFILFEDEFIMSNELNEGIEFVPQHQN